MGPDQLLKELGRGSYGVVFLAQRPGQVPCALKVIAPPDAEGRTRFKLEAAIGAKLDHPGIVPVFDIGQHGHQYYFAMEYCPGETLQQGLRQGALDPREAAELLLSLARTMAYAHVCGVIHRDLKPANVMLPAAEGLPRITDFGLARDRFLLQSMTRTGMVVGTPSYMSPEQVRGVEDLDARSDVYSLGVILYRCLTGRPPFSAATPTLLFELMERSEPLPPRRLQPSVPRALEAICLRAMAKDRDRRYPSAEALARDLEAFLSSTSGEGSASSGFSEPAAASKRLLATVAVVTGFTLLVGAGLIVALRGAGTDPVATTSVEPVPSATPLAPESSPPPSGVPVQERFERLMRKARQLARNEGPPEEVEEALGRIEELVQSDAALLGKVQVRRAEFLMQRGRYAEAGRLADRLRHREGFTGLHARHVLAQSRFRQGRHKDGLGEWQALFQDDPNGAVGLNAGALHGFFTGQRESHDLARRAVEIDPGYVPGQLSLAYALYEGGDVTGARAVLSRLKDGQDDNPRFHIIRGYVTSGEPSVAMAAWERVIELTGPGQDDGALQRVVQLGFGLRQFARARRALEGKLEVAPDDVNALVLRGLTWHQDGEPERARADWRRAKRLDPRLFEQLVHSLGELPSA